MKKTFTIILAAMLMLGVFTFNMPVSQAASNSNDTIEASISPVSDSVTTGGDIDFNVTIKNISAAQVKDVDISYGNQSCGGINLIESGATGSAKVTINVPTDKLGSSLKFSINYDANGTAGSLDVTSSVGQKAPTAKFNASCSVNRTASPVDGKINFTFELENTGEATLTNVKVSLPPIGDGKVLKTFSSMAPGVEKTFIYEYTMKENITVTPTIKYTANGEEKTVTKDQKALEVADPGLKLELSADNKKPEVGGEVNFTLKVTNTGNAKLKNIAVYDHLQQTLKSETTSLMPEKSFTLSGKYTFNQTTDVKFSATAEDNDGVKYNYESGKITISIPVDASKIKMDIVAKPSVSELTEPGKVKFEITVTNSGSYPLTDLVVSEEKLGEVDKLDTIEAGVDKVFTKEVDVSETGKYIFKVTAKDPDGNDVNAETAPLEIKLNAAAESSDPLASATDIPTESAAAAKGDTLGTIIIIMVAIAVLIIAVVVALIIMVNKEKKGQGRAGKPGKPSIPSKSGMSKQAAPKTVKYKNKNNF